MLSLSTMKKLLARIGGRDKSTSRGSTPALSDNNQSAAGSRGDGPRDRHGTDHQQASSDSVPHPGNTVGSHVSTANPALDATGSLPASIDGSRPSATTLAEPSVAPNLSPAVVITPAPEASSSDHQTRIVEKTPQTQMEP